MKPKHRNVTLTWRNRGTSEWNRLALSRKALVLLGGAFFVSLLSAVVLGGIAVHLYRQNARLHVRAEGVEAKRLALAGRLGEAEAEIAEAKDALIKVRVEEAKIRAWLGLDAEPADPQEAATESDGKGSLGEVPLDSVAPEDRRAEFEAADESTPGGVSHEARSLAEEIFELALKVERQKQRWDSVPSITPVEGDHLITSGFGWRRSPFTGKSEFHNGFDIASSRGTPIVAAADGVVCEVVKDPALGHVVTMNHGNGIQTTYGHMEKTLVKNGSKVKRGERIGNMGSSGKRSTGPHVHYAVAVGGKYVNPGHYILDRGRFPVEDAKR